MTELMRRRRALMGAGGSSDPNILFEWKPSDGLSNIVIAGMVSGQTNTNYEFLADAIRLFTISRNDVQYIRPQNEIFYNGNYTVEVEYKNLSGSANVYNMARCIDGNNTYCAVNNLNAKFSVRNGTSQSVQNYTNGKMLLKVNVSTKTVAGELYIGGSLAATASGTYAIPANSTRGVCGIDGSGGGDSHYVDITHIIVRKAA